VSDLTALVLFLMAVAVIVVLGILLGIILAGRMDRHLAPKPPGPFDDAPVASDGPEASDAPDAEPTDGEEHP